jgi:hypothetical protein
MRPIAERRAKTDFAVRTANAKRPKGCTIPIPSGIFVVDRSLPRMSCDVKMSDSDLSLSDIEINIDPEIAVSVRS